MFAKPNSALSKRPPFSTWGWGGGGKCGLWWGREGWLCARGGTQGRELLVARWEDTEEGVRRRRAEPGPAEGWRRQTPLGPSAPPPPPGAPPSPSSSRCLASSGSSAPASAAVAGRGRGGGASGGRGSRHPRGSRSGAEIPARRGRNPRGGRTRGSEPQGPGGTGGWAETRLSCPGSHAAHGAPSLVMVWRGGSVPAPRPLVFSPHPPPPPCAPLFSCRSASSETAPSAPQVSPRLHLRPAALLVGPTGSFPERAGVSA